MENDKRSGRKAYGPKKRDEKPPNGAPAQKFNHPEAFCLMQYQCERCQLSEILWNSRDGVTPFVIGCRVCSGQMKHENWQSDRQVVDYAPFPGQRVFITMPESLRLPLARFRIILAEGTPYAVPKEQQDEFARELAKSFQPDEPWIIEWPR